jgi:carboxymethylenebutenolidase
MTTMVTFPTASGDGQGLLALPPAPGPAVLLLPDYRGLAPDTVAAAQRLAQAGCPVLAVNFFHRVNWRFGDFDEQAPSVMLALEAGVLADDINGAAAFLLRQPLAVGGQVCAAGHDGGGALALWAAAICPRVAAVSAAYPDPQLWRAEGIRLHGLTASHVQVHLADDATSFRPADAQRLRGELEPAGTSVKIYTYPGTRHGFLTGSRPDLYDAAAAELVWERTMALANLAAQRDRAQPGGFYEPGMFTGVPG